MSVKALLKQLQVYLKRRNKKVDCGPAHLQKPTKMTRNAQKYNKKVKLKLIRKVRLS